MSQHDFNIDNQSAPAFRGDLNNALEALATLSSGGTAPSTTYANMLWYDSANNILKMRSEADDAWIDIGTLNQSTNVFEVANITNLSQAQAEDDTSTVFGQVSGERLAQAVAANETAQVEQKFIPTTTWEVNYDPRTGPTTISSDNITLPAGFYLVTLTISMRFFGAPSGESYSTSYEMRHIKNGSTVVLKSGGPSFALEDTTQVYSLTDQLFEFGGNDYFQTYEPDSSDSDHDDTTTTITVTAKGPYSNASYLV